MRKKMLWMLFVLAFVSLKFVACIEDAPNAPPPEPTQIETSLEEIPEDFDGITADTPDVSTQSYTRFTAKDYLGDPDYRGLNHYAFFLTSVEDRGDRLLLRGVFASEWLPYEKLEEARTGTPIEINGETFTHSFVYLSDNQWPTDILHNVRNGDELNLSPNGMIAFVDAAGDWHSAWYSTGIYREIEIDRYTPLDWSETSAADALSNVTLPYMVNGLFQGDSLWFHFDEHGEVTRISTSGDFCTT